MSAASGDCLRSTGIKDVTADELLPGLVNEEFANPVPQPGRPALLSRFSGLLSDVLDSFSFAFFCLSFSSLTYLFTAWCTRFLAEE